MQITSEIDRLGRFQAGLVTRRQITDSGASRKQRRGLERNSIVLPLQPGVYRMAGTPPGWEQDLLAACLAAAPAGVASHRAAALLWGLVDPPAPIEVTVPYRHRPLPRSTIRHRTNLLRPVDVAVRRGIPVTAPARTLLDLAAAAPRQLPEAMERCLYLRLLTTAALWRVLADVGGRGRRGTQALRECLESRALGDARPESLLEPLLADIAAAAGVAFQYQVPVVVEGHRYRLDFAIPALLLACEVDGLAVHGTRAALDSDLERQNRLVRNGWTVLRYTHTHLKRRRRAVRDEILAVIASIESRGAATLNPKGPGGATSVQRIGT